jgi:hypothetical protein
MSYPPQQQPQQQSSQYMPLSNISKTSPLSSTNMPSVSHQPQPQSNPPLESTELQQYKTDTKLYELLQKTRANPEFNQQLGDEILEELYDFSLDCSFFAKQRSDGRFFLPTNLPTLPPEHDQINNSQRPHPGLIKIPNSQPGSSYSTPQQQQQHWSFPQQNQQPGPSMQRPQMAGPSGQSMTPPTPLPIHPPEFHRFNLQAPIKHAMQSGSNPQQMRSPFYPPPSMTPEQQQMYLQQQQQQQQKQNGCGPESVRMMSPAYSQVPTPQSQHGGQFSRQSSFKMNTPQPMIKQDNPLQTQNSISNNKSQQQQQYSQQEAYFQGRQPHQIQRIDSNDNEMKPPLIPKHENGMDHRMPQQQRINGIMGQQQQHQNYQHSNFQNDLTSPKYQIKNELMSPNGTTSYISNRIQQSPLQANGQPMSSIGQTNVSPLVAITPPIGNGSPGCSSLAAVLASKPQSKSILAHAMDDPHRSTASPASEASTASTSSRKRTAEDDSTAPKIIKRPRCNPKNMPYTNMLNFILRYLPQTQETRMIPYICSLLLEHGKASKRVLEWKDEARTFTISKPRVFADRYKEALGLGDNCRDVSTTKMEQEMEKKLSKMMIGNYKLIHRIDQKTKTYMFLYGFNETPNLRENKTQLDLNQAGVIMEFPSPPLSAGPQSKFPPLPHFASGAPITA